MNGDRFIELVIWILSLVLAIIFFYNGVGKIFAFPAQVARFEFLGLPPGLLMVTGVVESIAGLMLTIPRLALTGSGILGVIMLASAGLHLSHGDIPSSLRALVIIFMLAGTGYLRVRRRHAQSE